MNLEDEMKNITRRLSLILVMAGGLSAGSAGVAVAQDDRCTQALTETGKNRFVEINQSDRDEYFFHKFCGDNSVNHSLDTDFKMAQSIFGNSQGKYASRD